MKINPFPGKLVLKMLEPATTTRGGLVLPDVAQEQLPFGEVLAAGTPPPRFTAINLTAESLVGATVVLPGFAGRTIELPDGQSVRIVDYEDVWASIEADDETPKETP